MRRTLAVTVLVGLFTAVATSQTPPVRLYTNPRLPPQEVLDRLSLTLAWSTRLPTEGSQDGLFSIQLLGPEGREELLVQTRAGRVLMVDPATGDILWNIAIGRPYELMFPAAANDENIYVTRHENLYVLNRRTGQQRLYSAGPKEGQINYGFDLGSVPSAAPAADQDQLYLCLGHNVRALLMPRYNVVEGAPAEGASPPPPRDKPAPQESSHQPLRNWNNQTEGLALLFPPVVVADTVNVISGDGTFLSLDADKGKAHYRFQISGLVAAPMGRHGTVLYVASEDHRVYAFDVDTGRLRWLFRAGAPVLHQPWVTDQDVYVAAKERGLHRVNRDSGNLVWRNQRAVRFLAENQRFVYALDRVGKLLILDRARGTTLTDYDLNGYPFPFSNEQTDRIFLGAHDGTLICLHHRDNRAPVRARALPQPAPKVEKKKDKAPEVKEEKKEEAKKDKGADKEDVKKKDKNDDKEDMKKEDMKKDKKDDRKKEDMEKDKKKDDMKKAKEADKAGRAESSGNAAWVLGARSSGDALQVLPPCWRDTASGGLPAPAFVCHAAHFRASWRSSSWPGARGAPS